MGKLKIQQTNSVTTSQSHDSHTGPQLISGNYLGGVGGDTGQAIPSIAGSCKIGTNSAAQCFLIAQKGSHKFRVQDASANRGVCKLVNKAQGSLLAGEMSITCTKQNASTFYASKISNRWVWDFAGNKYRYWFANATTNNAYAFDAAAGTVGFVKVTSA